MAVLPEERDILKPEAGGEVAVDLGQTEVGMDQKELDNIEVEVVDDTPEQDRGRQRRPEGAEPNPKNIPDDSEIANYSEGVQKRIKQLKYEYHEERRSKEEFARERDAAISYAKDLLNQVQRNRAELSQGEALLLKQFNDRIDAQLAQARSVYKTAFEAGDSETVTKAQEHMGVLQAQKVQLASYAPRYAGQQYQQPAQVAQPQQRQPSVQVPERALQWHQRNQWFQSDPTLTRYAQGVHDKLKQDGVQIGSEEYWSKLDEGMRIKYPERFEAVDGNRRRPTSSPVSGVSRTPSAGPVKVQLTQTEMNVIRKMGITPQQYAAQKLKLNKGANS